MPTDRIRAVLPRASLVLVAAAAILLGVALGRYPSFHPDEAFFAYPAWKAANGGTFAYVVSTSAPYATKLWAYHGPVLPRLLEAVFKLFGFSVFLSRLPNFVAGWAAVFLLVLWLKQRGFHYAGLLFAVLWCGDRAPLEIMAARMDGIALLSMVLAFLCLQRGLRLPSAAYIGLAGFWCGFSILAHPSCAFVPVAALGVVLCAMPRASAWFIGGGLLNFPLLALFWHGQFRASLEQLIWHLSARNVYRESRWRGLLRLLAMLNWSQFWVIALLLWSLFIVVLAARIVAARRTTSTGVRTLTELDLAVLSCAAFALATIQNLFRSPTYPPYLVFFTAWPILCFVLLLESDWKRYRLAGAALSLVWLTSLAWNAVRAREILLHYRALNRNALYAEMHRLIPPDAELIVTPEIYSAPIEAGQPHFDLTTWFPEHQDICPTCYVMMLEDEFKEGQYFAPGNIARRHILYKGPAFPGAGVLSISIMVLSPEDR